MDLLNAPLDGILGSTARLRLLRGLAPLGQPVSGRQAARIAGVPAKTAHRALEDLVALGVVRRQETSGSHLFTANRVHRLWTGIDALLELEGQHFEALRWWLAERLTLQNGVVGAAVFGSMARGEAVPGSDLDMLVLVDDEASADAVRQALASVAPECFERFGLELSPVVMSSDRFRERAAAGDPFVAATAERNLRVTGKRPDEVLRG
jgi:predicted nucleotidyltransferase